MNLQLFLLNYIPIHREGQHLRTSYKRKRRGLLPITQSELVTAVGVLCPLIKIINCDGAKAAVISGNLETFSQILLAYTLTTFYFF